MEGAKLSDGKHICSTAIDYGIAINLMIAIVGLKTIWPHDKEEEEKNPRAWQNPTKATHINLL